MKQIRNSNKGKIRGRMWLVFKLFFQLITGGSLANDPINAMEWPQGSSRFQDAAYTVRITNILCTKRELH